MTHAASDGPWRVLVVEDDPTVASVHCRLVAGVPGFRAVGVARTAGAARDLVGTARPDLVLLDVGLPGASGLAFLRWLRAEALPVEVVAVTASASPAVVRAMLHLGVLDHLVKPFTPDRLLGALEAFRRTMALLPAGGPGGDLAQGAVDRLRGTGELDLPKDLSRDRLAAVRGLLDGAGEPRTAEEVGRALGVARVTARRYLEHLAQNGGVTVSTVADGPGRPRKTYLAWNAAPIADRPDVSSATGGRIPGSDAHPT